MAYKLLTYLTLISFILTGFSCESRNGKEKIENYFIKTHNYKIGKDINKIIVVAEGKICSSCELAFAEIALEHLADSSVFLVSAKGNIVDINSFIRLKRNCFFDWQLNITDYPEFESSRVIYLKNNEIDTVVIIESKSIRQQLYFFINN